MKELNLEVGSKKWSIQLGDCEVVEIKQQEHFPVYCKNNNGLSCSYYSNGNFMETDYLQSLFESNPFEEKANLGGIREIYGLEPKFIFEDKGRFIEQKENKAELINALCIVAFQPPLNNNDIIVKAREKLLKLLESI